MLTGLEIFLIKAIIGGVAGAAAIGATAVVYWPKIIEWSSNSLLPLIERHFPSMSEYAKDAIVNLDNIAVGSRIAAKSAWGHLKRVFLGQIITIAKHSASHRIVTVANHLQNIWDNNGHYKVIRTQEYVHRDDLPAKVRETEIREGEQELQIDTWSAQDKMMLEMT